MKQIFKNRNQFFKKSFRNAYFQSPCNLGSELESAMEDSLQLHSLVEEEGEVGQENVMDTVDTVLVGSLPNCNRARKISQFDKTGSRFLDANSRNPFRHSYIDVRVHFYNFFFLIVFCMEYRNRKEVRFVQSSLPFSSF